MLRAFCKRNLRLGEKKFRNAFEMPKNVPLSIKVPQSLPGDLERLAGESKMTRNAYMRRVLEDAVAEQLVYKIRYERGTSSSGITPPLKVAEDEPQPGEPSDENDEQADDDEGDDIGDGAPSE